MTLDSYNVTDYCYKSNSLSATAEILVQFLKLDIFGINSRQKKSKIVHGLTIS